MTIIISNAEAIELKFKGLYTHEGANFKKIAVLPKEATYQPASNELLLITNINCLLLKKVLL